MQAAYSSVLRISGVKAKGCKQIRPREVRESQFAVGHIETACAVEVFVGVLNPHCEYQKLFYVILRIRFREQVLIAWQNLKIESNNYM